MLTEFDILIVGAGPAGCASAYDLARAGKRVLILDRRNFPRPKACACGLTRKTLKVLRYSVDPVIERVCHEIVLQQTGSDNRSVADNFQEIRVKTRNPICAMAVRERFDDFCLHQTLASGRNGGSVELRKTETILALRELHTHIEVDIQTAHGTETLATPVLIGADGANGQTRRLTNHGTKIQHSAQEDDGFALEAIVPYTELPTQLPGGTAPYDLVFDFAALSGGYAWLFPKGDHINIGVGAFAPTDTSSATQLKTVTRTLLLDYAKHKLGVAKLDHITGQHLGMGGHTYIPSGRVLLVGDAAGLVDPLTGEGIHSAIVSGQAAAAAILSNATDIAAAYARELAPLQRTLTFSRRAARAFYAEPNRGFKAMRIPLLRSLILKTYADGIPHTKLLTALARLV
jgi:geranylgeranyl reductase family protein